MRGEKVCLLIILLLLGLAIGLLIGYRISPLGVYDCFGKFKYQNITCIREDGNYHCMTSDGRNYRIENVLSID